MNKEIEEIVKTLQSADTECDRIEDCLNCIWEGYGCITVLRAEVLHNAGYRKTVWHKVADGDLPKPENGNVIAIPVQACYTNKTGIKVNGPCCFFFIDNTFRSLNFEKTLNVIAWTELPIYEVNKI